MPYIEVVVVPVERFAVVQLDLSTGDTNVLGVMEDRSAARLMIAHLSGLRRQLRHVRGDGSVRYPDVVHGIKNYGERRATGRNGTDAFHVTAPLHD